ncbi:hypothetical protein MTO96_007409 [Rhipicephalus appendiculatus]
MARKILRLESLGVEKYGPSKGSTRPESRRCRFKLAKRNRRYPLGQADAAEKASLSVASTSMRKPPAAGEKEACTTSPDAKRQGLKIDISFGKPPGPDKDGKLLKSISTNVEKIVARILARCGEDRQPLSRVDDTETSVIELDSQGCVSVGVTIADDVRGRRQPPPTSPVKASHGQATNRTALPPRPRDTTVTPTGTTTAERHRHDGPRRAPTPTSIVHLTVGPIHFGHSQPEIQAIPQPEGGRRAERRETTVERLPTERTTSRTPQETTTGQRMRQTVEKRLPQAQVSTGEPVRAIKEQHLAPEPASHPETKVKPGKHSDLTSIHAVDKEDVTKNDEESVRKPEPVPTRKASLESSSKKQSKATKDGRGEVAETQDKHSKLSEGSKTSAGSGTKLSSLGDVSLTEPEISGKGSSLIEKPSKKIAADEHIGPTEALPKQGAGSDEVSRSTTAKTVESETGETTTKTARTRELGELKDPDASAIERAQKQSLVRKERSEMGEKDLDDFRVGFELALSPYRVLVDLQPARSSAEDESTTRKGAKLPKGRRYDKKRRPSIVIIQKSDKGRKRKISHIDIPSSLLEEARQAAETGERAPGANRKKKRRRSKRSRRASRSRKTATASSVTREGKTSGAPDGSQNESALKDRRSARGSRRRSSDVPPSLRELAEKEEEEAKREKEKRRKRKKKERGKKRKKKKPKKRKHKKKRDRPIGYKSGNATCRVLCPVAVGLVFAVILLFLLLRALVYANTATTLATTVQQTLTVPTLPPKVPTVKPTPVPPPHTPPPPARNVYVCPTETCKREGAYIATLLKADSKPCYDLLGYVCDSWSRDHPVNPAGIGSFVTRGTLIQDALQRELLKVIQSAPDEDLKVVASLHDSCAKRPPRESPLLFWRKMFSTWVIRTWPANPKGTDKRRVAVRSRTAPGLGNSVPCLRSQLAWAARVPHKPS